MIEMYYNMHEATTLHSTDIRIIIVTIISCIKQKIYTSHYDYKYAGLLCVANIKMFKLFRNFMLV